MLRLHLCFLRGNERKEITDFYDPPPPEQKTPVSTKDVYGQAAQIVATLEEVIAGRSSKRRSANLLKFRKVQTLRSAIDDLNRLTRQAKELSELNPRCAERYELTLGDLARELFAGCQLE